MSEVVFKKGGLILAALGLWLCVAPATFGYTDSLSQTNDLICGSLLVLAGLFSVKTEKKSLVIFCALIGIWLQLAPLFFWAKDPASYLNDTFTGVALILVAFSLPKITDLETEDETPPGWSFNPSAWGPRSVTVFLALICWFLARYLASFQLGYIHEIYDPFFGDGSQKVVSSSVAQMFPVSDAGLGAFGYSLEFILGWIGTSRRWKTMPWLAVFFGGLVVPAGMISILLIVLQPVLVGAWCGLCLMIATCMLVMVLLTIPEVIAVIQLLIRAKKTGKGFWKVLWHGDDSPKVLASKPAERTRTSELGFTLPWNLVVSAFLGVWLMSSPSFFNLNAPASDSNYIVGPLLFAASILSFSEIIRSFRFVNCFLGFLLIAAAFLIDGFPLEGQINNLVSGAFAIILSFPRGKTKESYKNTF